MSADLLTIKRARALQDAIDLLRRAGSAVAAARWGEPSRARGAQLQEAQAQIEAILAALKALT